MVPPDHGELPPQVTEIFERYVRAHDEGPEPDPEPFLREAGAHRRSLQARIAAFREIQGITERLRTAPTIGPGTRLGRFEIRASLGEGGLAKVYLAMDPKLGRRVALKVIDSREVLDEERRGWVLREARSLARIEHPGVLRVYEVNDEEGCLLVVTEHLAGPSLAEVVAELRRSGDQATRRDTEAAQIAARLQSFRQRTACLEALARALAYCHDMGVLHRDIKPGNVVFDSKGAPKLIDFGLAHLEDADEDTNVDVTEKMMGTPAYLAPEQVDLGRTGADPRSDQFSFGTLAYELLSLAQPFHRRTRSETLDAVSRANPRPLGRKAAGVPPDLARVVHHALEQSPSGRYPTMHAMAADLQAILEDRPIGIAEPSLFRVLRLWARRNRTFALSAAASLVLLVSIVAAQWWILSRTEQAEVRETLALIDPKAHFLPEDFRTSVQTLLDCRTRAERFDRGLKRLLFGSLEAEVYAKIVPWSRRLVEVIQQERKLEDQGVAPFQGTPWRQIVDLEEQLKSGNAELAAMRMRGKALIPWDRLADCDHSMFGWKTPSEPEPFLNTLRLPYPLQTREMLDPGLYRLIAWKDNRVSWEACFVIQTMWDDPVEITGRRPERALLNEATEEKGTYVHLPVRAGPCERYVPAHRLLGRLITIREVQAYRRSKGLPERTLDEGELPDDPEWVTVGEAMDYAAWVGGRLPTSWELWLSERRNPGSLPVLGAQGHGEWTIDYALSSGVEIATVFKWEDETSSYVRERPGQWVDGLSRSFQDSRSPMSNNPDTNESVGVAFRIAFTSDTKSGLLAGGEFHPHTIDSIQLIR